jgi:hypothetical protein
MKTTLKCYVSKAKEPKFVYNENSITLDNSFVFTIREFELEDLEISDIEKIQGSIFNPTWVRAIFMRTSQDPTPFFIKEEDVEKLQIELIKCYL